MACFEALGFGNAWNIGMGCFRPVARVAEDLKVIGFICATKGEGQNVINVPRFAGFNLLRAT
jgi:hypothetical protein